MFAVSYFGANIESWNKACTLGKYYSRTDLVFLCSHLYMFVQSYTCVLRRDMFLQWL